MLKTRYNGLLSATTSNVQAEGLTYLCSDVSTAGDEVVKLQAELQVYNSSCSVDMLDNRNHRILWPYIIAHVVYITLLFHLQLLANIFPVMSTV